MGKTGYVPSRVLVEGLAEIGKDLGRGGRDYMAGSGGEGKKAGRLIVRKYRIFTKLMIEYENRV